MQQSHEIINEKLILAKTLSNYFRFCPLAGQFFRNLSYQSLKFIRSPNLFDLSWLPTRVLAGRETTRIQLELALRACETIKLSQRAFKRKLARGASLLETYLACLIRQRKFMQIMRWAGDSTTKLFSFNSVSKCKATGTSN